jgi:hypothetical protein
MCDIKELLKLLIGAYHSLYLSLLPAFLSTQNRVGPAKKGYSVVIFLMLQQLCDLTAICLFPRDGRPLRRNRWPHT